MRERDKKTMKAVMKLVINIDYDKLLPDDKIEALEKFMRIKGKDKLIEHHMNQIGQVLENYVKNIPDTTYQIAGDLIPEEKAPDIPAVPVAPIVPYDNSEQIIEVPDNIIDLLDEKIYAVSLELGTPKIIYINHQMNEYLKEEIIHSKVDIESKNSDITKFMGFDVRIEAMEDLFIIEYKSYKDGAISKYFIDDDDKKNT